MKLKEDQPGSAELTSRAAAALKELSRLTVALEKATVNDGKLQDKATEEIRRKVERVADSKELSHKKVVLT